MKKRPLGRTGLVVSEMSLGTWGLSGDAYGAVPPEQAEQVVRRAVERFRRSRHGDEFPAQGRVATELARRHLGDTINPNQLL